MVKYNLGLINIFWLFVYEGFVYMKVSYMKVSYSKVSCGRLGIGGHPDIVARFYGDGPLLSLCQQDSLHG